MNPSLVGRGRRGEDGLDVSQQPPSLRWLVVLLLFLLLLLLLPPRRPSQPALTREDKRRRAPSHCRAPPSQKSEIRQKQLEGGRKQEQSLFKRPAAGFPSLDRVFQGFCQLSDKFQAAYGKGATPKNLNCNFKAENGRNSIKVIK